MPKEQRLFGSYSRKTEVNQNAKANGKGGLLAATHVRLKSYLVADASV